MITVFLADDHATVREGLRLLINAQPDMQVILEAGDGITVVERARAIHPQVIVLDLAMPETNGFVAAKALRAFLPALRTRFRRRNMRPPFDIAFARSKYSTRQTTSSVRFTIRPP